MTARRAVLPTLLLTIVTSACATVPPPQSPSAEPAPSAEFPPTPTVATSAASPSPTAASAPASPGGLERSGLVGRIVFDHEFDIWVMNADGTDRHQLTDDPSEDLDAAWSPDGSMIAFRSHRDGNEEVYVVGADGTGERNLTDHPRTDYSPAWSPDGSMIAFATDRDADSGGNDIYVVGVAGASPRRMTLGGGIDEYPTWSPDGTQIAYACSGGRVLPEGVADFEVCVMNADGSDQRQLTDSPGLSDYPAWSPDGGSIAFQSTRGGWPTLPGYVPPGYEPGTFGEYDVYVMDADGGNVRNLTDNGRQDEQFPAWSPDGQHVVFNRYGCLVVAAADGSGEVTISDPEHCADGFPDWHGP